MRDVAILILHLIVTMVRLARPGGLRSVVAESWIEWLQKIRGLRVVVRRRHELCTTRLFAHSSQ